MVFFLGLGGALSIVRFRTAVKDPMDLLYLFWAYPGITTDRNVCAFGSDRLAVVMIAMIFLFYHKQQKDGIYIAVMIHYQEMRQVMKLSAALENEIFHKVKD